MSGGARFAFRPTCWKVTTPFRVMRLTTGYPAAVPDDTFYVLFPMVKP